MAFNSGTYRANKWARESREYLAKAREAKARLLANQYEYGWQREMDERALPRDAKSAIVYARLARSQRNINEINRSLRRG